MNRSWQLFNNPNLPMSLYELNLLKDKKIVKRKLSLSKIGHNRLLNQKGLIQHINITIMYISTFLSNRIILSWKMSREVCTQKVIYKAITWIFKNIKDTQVSQFTSDPNHSIKNEKSIFACISLTEMKENKRNKKKLN